MAKQHSRADHEKSPEMEHQLRPDGELAERIDEIDRLLEDEYGPPAPRRKPRPLDELILTILSQHTTDANSHRAFESLRQRFPTWEQVMDADPSEIAEAIRSGGLAQTKAIRIKELLLKLWEEYGALDMDFLCDMELDEARRLLLSLGGVGPKTAACVLLFSCGKPAFPVDTHIHRVARRLGLIGTKVTAEEAHLILEKVVPPEKMYPFHLNLIIHGRRTCKAQRPRCEVCPLAPVCNSYQ
ncbi:MAG: endonuclease III domain-containing protein [Chloroflexota bacterium]